MNDTQPAIDAEARYWPRTAIFAYLTCIRCTRQGVDHCPCAPLPI